MMSVSFFLRVACRVSGSYRAVAKSGVGVVLHPLVVRVRYLDVLFLREIEVQLFVLEFELPLYRGIPVVLDRVVRAPRKVLADQSPPVPEPDVLMSEIHTKV